MKILLAADGSAFTKKALAFLVTHETLCGPGDELLVLHVQAPIPPGVKTMVGAEVVHDWHTQEARKVLAPVERFLARHEVPFKTLWRVGHAAAEIPAIARKQKCHLVVMGTHGHGFLGRAVMGSVSQKVVETSEVPVLLVK
ncbi:MULTISPECIES: universal stress protein [Ramlibacter]|uniref:Universal stress protein n=1 Tax=Ramlibacter aquaticus TaxID=2780094 RepID=A0ABR9SBB5_9BURK|nr:MULTISPECIES: universal stress protein [Ramlibacter]MBE7939639.1 universal stress protein [Ramlibacter aquaticus]